MKKNKKLLLALGSIAAIAAPIAATVSCGSGSTTGGTTPGNTESGAVTPSVANYVSGSTVNPFLPTDSGDWYAPIVENRLIDEAGNGMTPFGLFSGVNQPTYDYGTLENSIAYNIGYLQTGKLFMIAYYNAHPETDFRSSLSQLGDVLNQTFTDYFKVKGADFVADALGGKATSSVQDDIDTVKGTLSNYKVADVLKSSAANITKLDYKGLFGLAKIFGQDKYVNAVAGSDEDLLGKAVMKHIGGVFAKFAWELHKTVTQINDVATNTKLFHAYDEVMGYSWDAFTGVLGDRKTPSPSLVKKYVHKTSAIDHNELIGNWNIDAVDYTRHKDLRQLETATKATGPYASQLYRFAADTFTENSALYNEAQNETLSQGIYSYDLGSPKYDAAGNLIKGDTTVRYLKFGLFDKITLTNKTDQELVFDSDDISATNVKSINGDAFKKAISDGAKSISAHIKDQTKYVKGGTGAASGNHVTAEDFWTYIQQTSYESVGQRNKVETFGGEELKVADGATEPRNSVAKAFEDAISTSKVNKSTSWSSPSKTEAASVPFFWDGIESQYGIEALKDTTTAHDNFVKNNSVNLSFKDNAEESATQLAWNTLFANPGTLNLRAVSTKNVQEKSLKFLHEVTLPSGVSADDVKDKPGIKYGVYYAYAAQKLEDFEYAGRYYVKENSATDIAWGKNKEYGGSWINKDTAPDSYTNHYIDQSGTYGLTFKDEFSADRIFTAPISDPKLLNWKNELVQNNDESITYEKSHTSAGDVGERFPTIALPFGTKATTETKYHFNEAFSKVLYGDTIPNIWKASTIEHLVEAVFHGTGLEFRSSLQAGINPYSLAHNYAKGLMGALSTYGPEASIPGKDSETVHKIVSDTEIFDRTAFGVNLVQVTDQDYRDIYTSETGDDIFHVGGDELTKIRANIVDALSKAGVSLTDKIISELPLDYKQGLNGLDTAKSLQHYLEALNFLNSQLEFAATVNPSKLLK